MIWWRMYLRRRTTDTYILLWHLDTKVVFFVYVIYQKVRVLLARIHSEAEPFLVYHYPAS